MIVINRTGVVIAQSVLLEIVISPSAELTCQDRSIQETGFHHRLDNGMLTVELTEVAIIVRKRGRYLGQLACLVGRANDEEYLFTDHGILKHTLAAWFTTSTTLPQ